MTINCLTPSLSATNRGDSAQTLRTKVADNEFAKILQLEQGAKLLTANTNLNPQHLQVNCKKQLSACHENGMNLALKDLAIAMEQQFLAFLWNLAILPNSSDAAHQCGEVVFHQELITDILKNTNTSEMGELAQQIYQEAVKLQEVNNAKKGITS